MNRAAELNPHPQQKILWLEAMRAIAALWVLGHHTVLLVRKYVAELGPEWTAVVNGDLGVDFFFVLSGFIIALSCDRISAQGGGVREYLRARLLRIYVPYLPIGVAIFILFQMVPSVSEGRETPGLLTSLLLLPSASPPALSVAWTLVHELVFYLIFSVYFLSKRLLTGICIVWAAAMAYCWVAAVALPGGLDYLLYPVNLCFLLGVCAFYVSRGRVGVGAGIAALATGLALVVSQIVLQEPSRVVTALAFVAFVFAATSELLLNRPPARWLIWLGAASYSIYLIHNPAISALVRIVTWIGLDVSPATNFLVIAFAALCAGCAYYMFYERPVLSRLRRKREPTTLTQSSPVAQAAVPRT
jgi:exopolysaccharide production protein ExoZ